MRIFKWTKEQTVIVLCLVFQIGLSQNRTLVVVDKTTGFPIDNAAIFSIEENEGTFTNSEGKAAIVLKNGAFKISKLGFDDVILEKGWETQSDTIFMIAQAVQLDEIVIKSFNLNKAIQYVLDNYARFYVHTPFEKECSFKETVSVDNQLKRLILSKINWWDKTYEFQKRSKIKLRLGAIDYNKNIPLDIFTDVPRVNENNSGYINPGSLISAIYLNSCLSNFVKFNKDVIGVVEESPSDQIIVSFESDWETTKEVSKRVRGKVIFDKKSKAVLEFRNTVEYQNNLTKGIVKESKKESITENKTASWRLTFHKIENDVLALKSFEASAEALITYDNKMHPVVFENSIYVFKETAVDKVNNDGLINLSKPIYQSLPVATIASTNTILLNKIESDFINGK
ncbi:carboxypeptidase-like regulatory domain-containing protein [Flavobacterium sp. Fl-318]|uniref:Carboxypeptidase-like regulatory domain-containing protein n=1 Tax=Flavobacterium cupriresistens TaxID=2893885 RepID=A0ABU4RDL5_9FLAO|nr:MULTISPECIES: carboxypeptidase-like regulatory domain-containing protein [unclassified Flavobacterium]MDX6189958.1 carboxypeptidase-like regulatory domain-containing protein [Flavobacterium sp. Fl-318]UFH42783.1 carboxypeptidase-like regulatory domain-containing protein [Flavobacterium sp. F-323]